MFSGQQTNVNLEKRQEMKGDNATQDVSTIFPNSCFFWAGRAFTVLLALGIFLAPIAVMIVEAHRSKLFKFAIAGCFIAAFAICLTATTKVRDWEMMAATAT